ncbi:hypothetical protein RJ641_011456 [Dillenia turbinata]|uniref:Plasma membrane fusion protein PRM1 n=1 Tax=Dillenia turbinata TaxID=194707 RepID=A0AAN8V5L4_9MAGN
MSNSNGFDPLILFLISSCLFPTNSVALGYPVARMQSIERPDPLRHFESYDGGFDLKNKHYWASAAFTGVHGYAIAGIWILCGVGFGIFTVVKNLRARSNGGTFPPVEGPSDSCYMIMFLLILVLTFLAILASGFVIAANLGFLKRTKRLEETLLGAGGEARLRIQNATDALNNMQILLRPYDQPICDRLNVTSSQLEKESRTLRSFIHKSKHSIDAAIQTAYGANVVVVAVNLVMLVASFAIEDFQQNPQNSSLTSILPCKNSTYSDETMMQIGLTVSTFIGKVLARFTCYKENSSDTCKGSGKIISEESYDMASTYTHSVQDLINIFPDLQSLAKCTFVREKFSDIVSHQCRPFRASVKLLWSSMLSLSTIMILLIMGWIVRTSQERGRTFPRFSITPSPSIP